MTSARINILGLPLLMFFLACTQAQPNGPSTEIVVTLTSTIQNIDQVAMRARNKDGVSQEEVLFDLEGHDLSNEPYRISIRPGDSFDNEIFLEVDGRAQERIVAKASSILSFDDGLSLSIQLELRADFVDNDGDGFEPCEEAGCDCNDLDASINPFRPEVCEDFVDHNCDGAVRENCPCDDDDDPVPCSGLRGAEQDLAGIGACFLGELRCIDGLLESECIFGSPTAEVSDNYIDDDCDGTVDEGSDCLSDQVRLCHRGFVDDPLNPNSNQRNRASDLAMGECADNLGRAKGIQRCTPLGWGSCMDDVLPQRRRGDSGEFAAGWAESMANPALNIVGQCDGLDNDCDGLFDEEPYFDGDQDGYTQCGTTFVADNFDPSVNQFSEGGIASEFIDCIDSDDTINPAQVEICGNGRDDDCRCDHDPSDRPLGTAGSLIGTPVLLLGQSEFECAPQEQNLDCSRTIRSANDPGRCDDGDSPFYAGYFGPSESDKDCYFCAQNFGLMCDTSSNTCSTQDSDCQNCELLNPPHNDDIAETRPHCTQPGPGCSGNTAPTWLPVQDGDPNNDCAALSCLDFFGNISGGNCFPKRDQSAQDVDCLDAEQCEDRNVLCAQESDFSNTALPRGGICRRVIGGCTDTTPPVFGEQNNGDDLFNECNQSFNCDGSMGGNAYYFGIDNSIPSTPVCYFAEDIQNNNCNANGACQNYDEACSASSSQGEADDRPLCQVVNSGCTLATPPSYENILVDQDPFDECPGALSCDGQGACQKVDGENCGSDDECGSGFCTDGVCCESLCDGSAEICCMGSCNDISPSTDTEVGTGDCSGTWSCNGTSAQFSSDGNACDSCVLDTASSGGSCGGPNPSGSCGGYTSMNACTGLTPTCLDGPGPNDVDCIP